MAFEQIFTAILSLVFVLGLLLVTVWLFKWLQSKSCNWCLGKYFTKAKSINIIEQRRIDAKNQIVLFEADNMRYLVLAGTDAHLLLNQSKTEKSKHD